MIPVGPPPGGAGPRTGLIIVSVVAGLLLILGGVMTFQWISTSGELDDTRTDLTSQIDSLHTDMASRDSEIETLQGQLEDAQEENELLTQSLEGSEGEVERLQEANEAIANCLDQIDAWLALIIIEAPEQEINNHYNDVVIPACDEASQYR